MNFIRRFGIAAALILVSVSGARHSVAQSQPTPATSEQSSLVDDLLDLLNEPQPPSKRLTESSRSNEMDQGVRPNLTPAEVGLDGEDLGERSDDPLEAVRQSMLIAAQYLQRGVTNSETQTLQGDIVQRLDELIAQLERSNPQQESDQQQREREREKQQRKQTQFSNSRRSTTAGDTEESDDRQGSQVGADNPGRDGVAADPNVKMSDPRVLQQSVWGQLPDQVRKQMQSRMVERFLPSYREQIEAYFQALLKEQP